MPLRLRGEGLRVWGLRPCVGAASCRRMRLSLRDESLAIRGLLPLWRRGLRQLRKPCRPRSSPTTAKRSSLASPKRSQSFVLDQIWSARSTRNLRCGGRRWFPNSSPSRPWSLLGGSRSRLEGVTARSATLRSSPIVAPSGEDRAYQCHQACTRKVN